MISPIEHPHEPSLQFDMEGILNLVQVLKQKVDFAGKGPPERPWGDTPSLDKFQEAYRSGIHQLPLAYVDEYAQPLQAALERICERSLQDRDNRTPEALLGAIYCHAPQSEVRDAIRRLTVVVSHFFSSFLNDEKRLSLNLPVIERLPPLATFQHYCGAGPYTIPTQDMRRLIRSDVSVVSLPSPFRDHPILWSILAHETGGHDVQNAHPGMQQELSAGVRSMFEQMAARAAAAGNPMWASANQFFGKLWAFWSNEAAADVFGILNVGPIFAVNLNAQFLAMMEGDSLGADVIAQAGAPIDSHPSAILRIYLAIGAIDSLVDLAPLTRRRYRRILEAMGTRLSGGAEFSKITGLLPDLETGRLEPIDKQIPLGVLQQSAIAAGRYFACVPLQSLGGYSVQALETWGDNDERITRDIIQSIRERGMVGSGGDPSHILAAGSTLILNDPSQYDTFSAHTNDGIERCFSMLPEWRPFDHDQHAQGRFGMRPPTAMSRQLNRLGY